MKLRKRALQVISLMMVAIVGGMSLVGCSNKSSATKETSGVVTNEDGTEAPYKLKFMTTTFSGEPLKGDGGAEIKKKIEEYTNTELEFIWVPDSAYADKMNIMLASDDMPHVMLSGGTGKTPSIINAAKSGALWEISDYLKDYENLSRANEITLQNSSFNGEIYGIYRGRPLGRNGMFYRKDWLDNLGMSEPTTIDEFYDMLYAFTYNDPDGNGKDDTYGLAVSKYAGPWDIIQTWMGVPNGWGEQEDGTLVPAHLTTEYKEALDFFRNIYSEGLVNSDFAVLDTGNWNDLIRTGKAGVMVDVTDGAHRTQEYFDKEGVPAEIGLVGAVEGKYGLRNLPTSGYSGIFVITKGAKTETDLRRVLQFMDDMNDVEMRTLCDYGIEGTHYTLDENGAVVVSKDETVMAQLNDANQLMSYVVEDDKLNIAMTPLRERNLAVQKANEDIVVANPAFSYISDTYTRKGPQLDEIVNDARIQYIVGQIDEKGLQDKHDLWLKTGGQEIINEMNEIHKSNK